MTIPPPPPGQAPRRRSLLGLFLGLSLVGFLGFAALLVLVSLAGSSTSQLKRSGLARNRIAVIGVSGVITSSSAPSLFGEGGGAGAEQIIEHVRAAAEDDSVKVVILRINSPGGSAAASQEVYDAIIRARDQSRKPFVASLADMAASGGYYIAAACDKIMANRSTFTGSIGVIIAGYDVSGLLSWVRVKPEVIKSGKFKDLGSGGRPMRPEERQMLQAMVDNVYQQFLGDVARGRKLPPAQLKPLADGRVFTGEQAKRVGLVDDLGGFWDAVALAQKLARLPADDHPNLYRYGEGRLLDQLLSGRAGLSSPAALSPVPRWLQGSGFAPLWLLAPLQSLPMTGS